MTAKNESLSSKQMAVHESIARYCDYFDSILSIIVNPLADN